MNLQKRIEILVGLGDYFKENSMHLQSVIASASEKNAWFIPEFIELAIKNIQESFLDKDKLESWAKHYHVDDNIGGKNIGLVMAGNIPLVGFHDFLAIFMSGHRQTIKLSSRDDVLLKHLVDKLTILEPVVGDSITFANMLNGCDAYIATGSNNSARYFEQYFSKYPHIIRRNRTAVAVLTGNEKQDELFSLSDDIHQYFGLGCRNVTRLFVPEQYDFEPLLRSFVRYRFFNNHHKYMNNYDYQLSISLLNKIFYMTDGTTLLIEEDAIFSAISRINYSFYTDYTILMSQLLKEKDIQCIVGHGQVPFGEAQRPGLMEYADGIDTLEFLLTL